MSSRPHLKIDGKVHGEVESIREVAGEYIATVRHRLPLIPSRLGNAYLTDEVKTNKDTFDAFAKWQAENPSEVNKG